MGKSTEAIKEIMDKGIEWYDYEKLTPPEKKLYWAESQRLLRSNVLLNEVNYFISDLVKEIAFNSENYEKVVALRYSINGVKTLMERLEMIKDPSAKEVIDEDLDEAI